MFQTVICNREISIPFSVLKACHGFYVLLLLLFIISIMIIQNFLFLS